MRGLEMIVSAMKTIGVGALALCLVGCRPPHDVRPPYHEPAAAKPASAGDVAPQPGAPSPDRR